MEKRKSKLDGCGKERWWDQLGVPPESASVKGPMPEGSVHSHTGGAPAQPQ